MEKPLCKICKERHNGLCPSFAAKVGSSDAKPAPTQPRAKALRPQAPHKERANVARSEPLVSKAVGGDKAPNVGFDRVAYQRLYMRQRRAKQKEAKNAGV